MKTFGAIVAAALALAAMTGSSMAVDPAAQEKQAAAWTLPVAQSRPASFMLALTANCGKWPKCQDEACVGGVEHDCRKDNGTRSCTAVPRDKTPAKTCKVS